MNTRCWFGHKYQKWVKASIRDVTHRPNAPKVRYLVFVDRCKRCAANRTTLT